MKRPRQLHAEIMGAGGCYLLSLIDIAEDLIKREIDVFRVYADAVAEKWMTEDCYLERPARILTELSGEPWDIRKEGPEYLCKPGEYEILRYEREIKTPGKTVTIAHFVRGDGKGKVLYDPYEGSRTVRDGHLVSKRIFGRAD